MLNGPIMQADRLRDEEGRLAALRRYELGRNEVPIQRVVDLAQQILDVPMTAATLIDAERQWIKAAHGLSIESIPRRDCFCDETIRRHDALMVADATDDWRFAINPMVTGPSHVRAYLGVPLTTPDGYNIGTLCAFDDKPHEFSEQQAGIMKKLAEIIVEQVELEQIAKQDALTGAMTRRGFFAEVEREFLRAARYDRPSALAMIDVDNFRAINERYGHRAGDAVLTAIAGACMATMRKSDVFGRIGGEEFGLLLPETDPGAARDAAERVRGIIAATIVEAGGAQIKATVSVGVAPMPAVAEGAATWLSEADIALYEAKNFGRNRVVVGKARRPAPLPTDLAQQQLRPN